MSTGKVFKRHDTETKGRHLVATQKIQKDQLIFVEKPLLSLQSVGNIHQGVLVCRRCRAFVGGPDLSLAVASGRISRENVLDSFKEMECIDERCKMVSCRNNCGEIYCSKECEEEMWNYGGHELMCTGLIPDPESQPHVENNSGDEKEPSNLKGGKGKGEEEEYEVTSNELHPLLKFKLHAVQSNEIFLMVGDLVATVISVRRRQIESERLYKNQNLENHSTPTSSSTVEDIIAPYLDFTLKPWWDVVTEPMASDPKKLDESVTMNKILRELCSTSASLLKDAIISLLNGGLQPKNGHNDNDLFHSTLSQAIDECIEKYDLFSELFFGKIIGSFEQNSMGIRARHPLCRDIIEDDMFRERGHSDLVRCLELADMIGESDEDESQNEGRDKTDDEGEKIDQDNDIKGVEEVTEAWENYTFDEIAEFIAGLQIDEEGNNGIFKQTENNEDEHHSHEHHSHEHHSHECHDDQCHDDQCHEQHSHECHDDQCHDDQCHDDQCHEQHSHKCHDDKCDEQHGNDHGGDEQHGHDHGDDDKHSHEHWGDELEELFTPFDGTAMYYTTCKMNHSCIPNVVVRYSYSCLGGGKRARWGKEFPLVVSCYALRDIDKDEELCISYIDSDMDYKERFSALENYGFQCRCKKCTEETDTKSSSNETASLYVEDDLFGAEDELFGFEDDEDEEDEENQDDEDEKNQDDDVSGNVHLMKLERDLNKAISDSSKGSIPMNIIAPVVSFALQLGSKSLRDLESNHKEAGNIADNAKMRQLLRDVTNSLNRQDYVKSLEAATSGENLSLEILHKNQCWPSEVHRDVHRCFSVTAALGYAKTGTFLPALKMMDKAIIFGVPRQKINYFLEYIEFHASNMSSYPNHLPIKMIPDYKKPKLQHLILKEGLSAPIKFPTMELDTKDVTNQVFECYFSKDEPLVIRGIADSWPALKKWRELNVFAENHGHRVVPIEKGIMTEESGLKEQLITIKEFISSFLDPSSSKLVWPAGLSKEISAQSSIAYLAQHHLFEQIPDLLNDIEASPSLCGKDGPTHVNTWIGTGGTRTPCHYDSYDNLLVQVVGAKYVRLYHPSETEKLHVMKQSETSYGKQGNISSVDCEFEDYSLHPMAEHAKYSETVLFPGDCIYIPSRHWHYVRSCCTSASVNFWF